MRDSLIPIKQTYQNTETNSYVPFFTLFSPTENISTPGPHPMTPQIRQANAYRPIFVLFVIEALYQNLKLTCHKVKPQ